MSRSTIKPFVITTVTLLVGGSVLIACGGGAELSIIRSFFQASRYGDRVTLANMSMVTFDPQEDGIASRLSVDSVTDERRRALRLRDLAAALEEVQASEDEFREEKKAYQDEHVEAITRVIEADRADESVSSGDQEVQLAWTTWRELERAFARKVSDAQNELSNEGVVAEASVYDRATRSTSRSTRESSSRRMSPSRPPSRRMARRASGRWSSRCKRSSSRTPTVSSRAAGSLPRSSKRPGMTQ